MRNKSLASAPQIFSQCYLILLVLSVLLASCSSDQPAVSAERWYGGYHSLDSQIVSEQTCSTKLSEATALLQKNSETIRQYSSYSFDISQLDFQTVEQGGEWAVVEVTGREIIFSNQQPSSTEIKKNWQFIREFGGWKWCGELPYVDRPSRVPIGIVAVVGLFVMIGFAILILSNRPRDYSEFYTQSERGVLHQIQEYEAGWVRSFSKLKGFGFIESDQGHHYYVDYASFVDQRNRELTIGERVLFQAEWSPKGPRARNIIRVESQTGSPNPHSRKLIILADRVKRLRQDFRLYQVARLGKELDTCKSFLELLDGDIKRYHIRLMDYEVVLMAEVGRDLEGLSEEIKSMSDDSRWWARIIHALFQIFDIVADMVQLASPQTAELLRSMGRRTMRLLAEKKRPLLGPGKE